jgi:hypothetical protein
VILRHLHHADAATAAIRSRQYAARVTDVRDPELAPAQSVSQSQRL